MLPQLLCLIAAAGFGQTPESYFRTRGASFRESPPEQRVYWQGHIEHSYRRILEAADLAKGRAVATVLGSGVGAEIPLAELARRFDRLILVDMDGPSLVESLQKVPLDLRPRVELRVMDVTSFVGALMEGVSAAVESSSTAEEALRRLAAVFDNLAAGKSPKLPPSDLVVSSLLLSEIPRYPFGYADRLMQQRFNTPFDAWGGFDKGFSKLVLLSIEDHARLLASLSRPGGAVYYSDTFARGPAYRRFSVETRAAVEAGLFSDFRRLGLADSAAGMALAIGGLCQGRHPLGVELEAFERLLAAYWQNGDQTFEALLPAPEVQRQFKRHGFSAQGTPESWWWLSYPCAIAQAPGGFRVSSWFFRRTSVP